MKIITKNILKKIYKKRIEGLLRKYDFGLLLVLGGGEFYSGSPAFVSMAAFRAGVDMVRVIAPKRAADIIAGFSPNLAAYPLKGDYLLQSHLDILLSMVEFAKIIARGKVAVVIGGGLGRNKETQNVILDCLSYFSVPVIIEDDAIYALKKRIKVIANKEVLISFRKKEFEVLFEKDISKLSLAKKTKFIEEKAKECEITILYKGQIDIISDGQNTILNKTGTPFMAIQGSGCVLAGIGGALMARQCSVFDSACAAAYINGLAGEIVSKSLGESLTAVDLLNAIPIVINKNNKNKVK